MNPPLAPTLEAPSASPTIVVEENPPSSSGSLRGIWIFCLFVWKYFVGVLLCQTAVTSVLVVGWTYRWCQRVTLGRWWKMSRTRDEEDFDAFLQRCRPAHRHRPNWMLRQNFRREFTENLREASGFVGKTKTVFRALFGSLGTNLKLGLQGILNTWLLTMPGCALWLVAWYDGWNNSFNKGYEQAAVGPLTGLFGVALFIAAMLYVPMAQARQASTGSWRSFFQFRLIWGLARRHKLACLGLAVLYSLVSLPVMVLKTAPGFFPQAFPNLEAMSDAEILATANTYFFWAAAVVLPAYLLLHLAAARLYATALVKGIADGHIALDELESTEKNTLAALDLLEQHPRPQRHVVIRTAGRSASFTFGTALLAATAVVWFTFVAQIFISEFLNYHPGVGWLNQPLVQLPWFHYVPGHLTP